MICHDLSIFHVSLYWNVQHLNRRLLSLRSSKRSWNCARTPTSWQNPKLRNHPPRKATDVWLNPCIFLVDFFRVGNPCISKVTILTNGTNLSMWKFSMFVDFCLFPYAPQSLLQVFFWVCGLNGCLNTFQNQGGYLKRYGWWFRNPAVTS